MAYVASPTNTLETNCFSHYNLHNLDLCQKPYFANLHQLSFAGASLVSIVVVIKSNYSVILNSVAVTAKNHTAAMECSTNFEQN